MARGFLRSIARLFNVSPTIGNDVRAASASDLRTDIDTSSKWVAEALTSSGYQADFHPESIAEIERFFHEQTSNGKPVRGGLLSENMGMRLFALGSYCGEVLRMELGGDWIVDNDDPEGEINAALQLADDTICWPIQRVMKRMQSDENNLVHWAAYLRGELA